MSGTVVVATIGPTVSRNPLKWLIRQSQGGTVAKKAEKNRNGLSLSDLRDSLRSFAAERDWDQYHSPKNLAAALVVEAGELLEHFQWLTESASQSLTAKQLSEVREEMADVLIYLVRLADKLNIELLDAAREKIEKNALKYPVKKSRGSSRKYTDL